MAVKWLHRILSPCRPVFFLVLIFMVLNPVKTARLPALYRFRVGPQHVEDLKAANFEFWKDPSLYMPVQVVAKTEEDETKITEFLSKHNLLWYRTEIDKLLDQAEERMRSRAELKKPGEISWDAYYTLDEFDNWLDSMCEKYTNLAKCSVIGESVEKRHIRMIQISNGNPSPDKQIAFIDSLHHAREWVTLSVTSYIINELLVNSTEYGHLLDKLDIYIIPVVNPDGYAYSHTPRQRFWRKNRQRHPKGQEDDECNGVDINRNYGFEFKEYDEPCADAYPGASAFSEPETQAIRDVVLKEKGRIRFYFTMHSFGQFWLLPWGYQKSFPPDHPEVLQVAMCGANASMQLFGTEFKPGGIAEILVYPKFGVIGDWLKAEADVKFSFGLELRDQGESGFELPEEQILPAVQETWAGVLAALFECNVPPPDSTPATDATTPTPSPV